LIHDEPTVKWLLQGEVIESLKILVAHDLPFDVVGTLPGHIKTALEVSNKVPGLKMVFDHLNQPPISSKQRFGEWGDLVKEVAKNQQFYAKISGLGNACKNNKNWTSNDIKPYIEFAFENFGTDRCFCGGDWPVSLLAESFTNTWKAYIEAISDLLTEQGQEKVFYTNAQKFYQL
jgi:L-fuconolactonase